MSERGEQAPRKVGVVAVCVRAGRLLVIRRSQRVRAPGKFCFPGGAMEQGEFEDQTLIREMQEELGVRVKPIRRLHRSITSWRVDLRWWLADLGAHAELVPAEAEVESVHWLTVEDFLALDEVLDSNREFLAAWRDGIFDIDGLERPPPLSS